MKRPYLAILRAKLRASLSRRTPRERVLLLVLAAAIAAYGTTTFILLPMLETREEARQSIARSDAILARLAVAPPLSQEAQRRDDRPVTTIVTETAPQFDLTIRRLEPEGSGARLVLEDADYAKVINWLDNLVRDHGLRVGTIELERRPDPGTVGTRLMLEEGRG